MLLAIDTATRYAGLALYDGERVLAEFTWRAERSHTATLIPNLTRMLSQQALTVSDVESVGVALGPGSFTGLRIGMAAAKGLALARDLPLVGVPTLDIVAYSCQPLLLGREPLSLCALVDAGRRRSCVAHYRWTGEALRQERGIRIMSPDEVGAGVEEPTLFCGEVSAEVEGALRERLGDRAMVVPAAARLRRPGYLAQLAWERLAKGEGDDPAALSPIYVHFPPRRD